MQLFSASRIKEWDNFTLRQQGISSQQLMERAAQACTTWLVRHFDAKTPFVVLCGCGNNGGDGLAITRFLLQEGYGAKALLLQHQARLSADALAQQQLLPISALQVLETGSMLSHLPENVVLVDAILGAGLSRPLSGWLRDFVQGLASFPNTIVSIDVPTGLMPDALPEPGSMVVKATHTLCLQQYKRSLLHPEGGKFGGQLHRIEIGLDAAFTSQNPSPYHTIDATTVQSLFQQREPFSHKGTLGTAMVIAGSFSMMGAAALAASAAGHAGAGKVRALVPECGYNIIQTLVPEALCITSGKEHITEMALHTTQAAGILAGPGMGQAPETMAALKGLLEASQHPLVLDADAINILAKNKELLALVPALSILTPHPKEFERLFGETPDSMARLELAREKAKEHNLILIMKDRYTAIVTPSGDCWYNLRGSVAMATGGSGDVLAGILAGLLAQQYSPFAAAILGVHLHAAAGEYAAQENGVHATVAGDLVKHLGDAFKELEVV